MAKIIITLSGTKGSITIDVADLSSTELYELVRLSNEILSKKEDMSLSELDGRLIGLIKQGQTLAACRLKKEESNIGLREAKDYVDRLKEKFCK